MNKFKRTNEYNVAGNGLPSNLESIFDASQQQTQDTGTGNTHEDEQVVNDRTTPQSPSRLTTTAVIQEDIPHTPLRDDNDTQSVAGTPGPVFSGHTQSVMGKPFGGDETPVAGTHITIARSVASSQIGRMDLSTMELRTQSPNQSMTQKTDMAAVEGTLVQAPPAGSGGEVSLDQHPILSVLLLYRTVFGRTCTS